MAPAWWNLILLSRYDDSIARTELLPLNAVTDMSALFSGVLIVEKTPLYRCDTSPITS